MKKKAIIMMEESAKVVGLVACLFIIFATLEHLVNIVKELF